MDKEKARPLAFVIGFIVLCILGILDAVNLAEPPTWIISILTTFCGAWPAERAIRKGKGGNDAS